jgi:protein SCO1/2
MKTQIEVNVSRRRMLALLGTMVCGAGLATRALAGDDHAVPTDIGPRRSLVECKVPRLDLVRQDGSLANFPDEFDDGWPIILNFFSTSCPTCRTSNRTLSEMQDQLGPEKAKVRFMSISVDPLKDTPDRLKHYAGQLQAHDHWQFYTGAPDKLLALQAAFDTDRSDGSQHRPITFLRGAPCQKWVRLDGYADAETLVREYRDLRKLRSIL